MADHSQAILTVVEAARVLRISRGLAYELARRWLETEGREGLPVIKLGRTLRVPRAQLDKLIAGEAFTAASTAPPPQTAAPRNKPLALGAHADQLRLLDPES